MDEFADFDGFSVFALGAILLLMTAWGCAIVAIDRWVWAGRSDLPPWPASAPGAAVRARGGTAAPNLPGIGAVPIGLDAIIAPPLRRGQGHPKVSADDNVAFRL